jgi:putative protease
VTLSAAAINAMRRDALNQLLAMRARWEPTKLHRPEKVIRYEGRRAAPSITVQVTDLAQITDKLLRTNPEVLYVPLHLLVKDPVFCHELARKCTVAAVLPRIVHDHELSRLKDDLKLIKDMGVREVLTGNVGMLLPVREAGLRVRGDFGLNLYNSASVNLMKELGMKSATLSFEMTLPQIRDVSKAVPCEIFAYGRLPLMITENCLIRNRTGTCTCSHASTKLADKTGADFPIIKDGDKCRSVVLNGKKLNWLDRQKDLAKLGVWAIRLYFTTENPREVDQVLGALANPPAFDPGSCTRGLYLRGLD